MFRIRLRRMTYSVLSKTPNISPNMSDRGISGPKKLNPNSKDAIITEEFLPTSEIALACTRPRKYTSSMIASSMKIKTVSAPELIPKGK